MKRWMLAFTGRKNGALGITYRVEIEVEAETAEAARMRAYNTHEHIAGGTAGVRVREVPS